MKKVLVIGAGFLQSFVIKKAREMGYYTLAIDKNPDSIGFEFADEYKAVDIIDQDACLKYALEKNIDGVLTAATDYGVLSAAFIAQEMGLPGLNYKVAKTIKNKYMVRRTLSEHNVDDVAQYYEISDVSDLDDLIYKINFPVMVKPCDGSGSKGALRVDTNDDLKIACEEAIKSSLMGRALIEDFIEGEEYGVESFVYNGEIHVLGVMKKFMTSPPIYAELGHCMPSQLRIEEKVREIVKKAINALAINYGAVNMDVLVTKDNHVCIVDVGARMGGNLICSHIIPYGTGIDYIGNLIRAAVGESVKLKPERSSMNVATRLLALKPGKVQILPNIEEIKNKYDVEIYLNLKVESEIREYKNNLDGCGYVVSVSDDLNKAVNRVEKAKNLIDLQIIRW